MIDYDTTPRCRRCNATGWERFSWDGYCLMCEEENDAVQLADLDEDEL